MENNDKQKSPFSLFGFPVVFTRDAPKTPPIVFGTSEQYLGDAYIVRREGDDTFMGIPKENDDE